MTRFVNEFWAIRGGPAGRCQSGAILIVFAPKQLGASFSMSAVKEQIENAVAARAVGH